MQRQQSNEIREYWSPIVGEGVGAVELFIRIVISFYLLHQFFLSISFCSLHCTHCCVCQLCFIKRKLMMMMMMTVCLLQAIRCLCLCAFWVPVLLVFPDSASPVSSWRTWSSPGSWNLQVLVLAVVCARGPVVSRDQARTVSFLWVCSLSLTSYFPTSSVVSRYFQVTSWSTSLFCHL